MSKLSHFYSDLLWPYCVMASIKPSSLISFYRFPGVAIELDTGEVFSTKCTCVQRLAGRCKHVACILYLLEEVGLEMKPKLLETCTSVDCYWNKGAINNKNPGPIGMH